MQLEYDALLANQTWTLTSLQSLRKHVGCKLVFKVRENVDGKMNKWKAILVAKGCHQQFGIYFNKTFSPVVKPTTIIVIPNLSLANKWELQQIDINNAFLNGLLYKRFICLNHLALKSRILPWFISWTKSYMCLRNLKGLVWKIGSSTDSIWLSSQ